MPDLSLLPPSAATDGDDLRIGGCLMSDLAERFGTPAFVFDEQALRDRGRELRTALTGRHQAAGVCFAVKACPSASVIKVLAEEGLGCDVVGAGELAMALAHLLAQLLDELVEPHHAHIVEIHPLAHHPVDRLADIVGI